MAASMTEVVVPIAAPDATGLAGLAARARDEGADLVEIRLDRCADLAGTQAGLADLIEVIPALALPALVTLRHAAEGGSWAGDEAERIDLYRRADQAGAAWIDVELARFQEGHRPTRAGLVLSHHDFSGMGGDLPAIVQRMQSLGCAVAKIAVTPTDAGDLQAVVDLHESTRPGSLCAIAMGEHGLPSRLLAGCWGSAFTFARLTGDLGTAPGQPTAGDLLGLYRLKRQGPSTRIYGVIGRPIAHSLSPLIHNTALAQQGLDAVYVPFLVEDPSAFWRRCGSWIDGLSITIPHKHDLLAKMDRLEPLAQRIGAMNTIWREADGTTVGDNTDAIAAARCVETGIGNLRGRKVLLLGAGGVSRGIAFAMADRGAQVTIANRGRERAESLARDVGARVVDVDLAPLESFDVLINGTAVGMDDPSASPWPANAHRDATLVFDTVYTPLETKLVKEAQLAHARTICGLSMFIGQAAEQYRRWFGVAAPEELMHRVALERLATRENRASAAPRRKDTSGLESTLGGG